MSKRNKNLLATPFLKWAGGKRQLLPVLRENLPPKINTYYEPFVGAGAFLFDMQPKNAVINDINSDLINTYKVIKESPLELIEDLKKHENTSEYFYEMRDKDRTDEYIEMNPIERASRLIYLNKTCFNGLFRVNRSGQFNVPYGRYKNPNIVNEPTIKAVSSYLNKNNVQILNQDFTSVVENAKKGDFVYFDPPYASETDGLMFTGYTLDGFNVEDQKRLAYLFIELDKKGVYVMLSNSSVPLIHELYEGFNIKIVPANRNINSKGDGRGKVDEVLIMNY